MTNNVEPQTDPHGPEVRAYLTALPRDERAYAASYAHWLSIAADVDDAVFQASAFAVGIRHDRRLAIRRTVDRMFAIEILTACSPKAVRHDS